MMRYDLRAVLTTVWRMLRPRRRWLRFSIATLLLAMTAACVVLGVITQRGFKRAAAIRAIERAGGTIVYAHQLTHPDYDPLMQGLGDAEAPFWAQKLGKGYAEVAGINLPAATISEADFDGIGLFTQARSLHVSWSWLDDARLLKLEGLANLRILILSRTRITDVGLAALAEMNELKSVGLFDAAIEGPGLANLANKTSLEHLSLAGTDVDDAGLAHLSSLTQLEGLDLRGSRVTDAGLVHLARLTKLQQLGLSGTQVTGDGLRHIAQCKQLTGLNLSNTPLDDLGLVHLTGLSSLAGLDLSGTRVAGPGLAGLGGLTKLERLHLHGCPIDDAGIVNLPALPTLQYVDASCTSIGDAGAAWLAKLPWLVVLRLDDTRVSDRGATALGQTPYLRQASLNRSDMGDDGFVALCGAPQLTELNAYDSLVSDVGLDAAPAPVRFGVKLDGTRVSQAGVDRYKKRFGALAKLELRERPRRGPAATARQLQALANIEEHDSADALWERGVALSIANRSFGFSSMEQPLTTRQIAAIFRTATERADQPAPIFVAWGDSQPDRQAIATASSVIQSHLADHPESALLRQILEGADPQLLCYAAAAALDVAYTASWERVATFSQDAELARLAAEVLVRQNPDNALGYLLLAGRLPGKALAELRFASLERGLAAPRLEWHDTPLPAHVFEQARDGITNDEPVDDRCILPIKIDNCFVDGGLALAKVFNSGGMAGIGESEHIERKMALAVARTMARMRDSAAAAGSNAIGESNLPHDLVNRLMSLPAYAAAARNGQSRWNRIQRVYHDSKIDRSTGAALRLERLLPDLFLARQAAAIEVQQALVANGFAGSLDWLVETDSP